MAAVTGTLPARRSRIPGVAALLAHRAKTAAQAIAKELSGGALTIAGFACVDVGAFTANTVAGWVVTGLSVLALDWVRE